MALAVDLALAGALIVVSGLVVAPGKSVTGRLFYATPYPLSAALAWGTEFGIPGALVSAAALGAALTASRQVNGISLAHLSQTQVLSLGNGVVQFLLAGLVAGVVARHLDRSAVQLRSAIDDAITSREQAARLDQHRSMARAIHDSVLQALAFINKCGRELADLEPIPGNEVLRLAQMADEQEHELRTLILREPEDAPSGTLALRDALEAAARNVDGLPVTVSAVGPIWLPVGHVEQVVAAVGEALDNVVEHAHATRAAVFAELEDGWVSVSVRDDGRGFVYSEEQLRAQGKAGMLSSMKGRVEDLGGRMRVQTAPGAGTEVEFRIPVRSGRASSAHG